MRVADGTLQLTARVSEPATVSVEDRVRGYDQFTTAIVKSKQRIRYGYFEALCRSMRANVCNAFWLYDPLSETGRSKVRGAEGLDLDVGIRGIEGSFVRQGNVGGRADLRQPLRVGTRCSRARGKSVSDTVRYWHKRFHERSDQRFSRK